MKCAYTLKQSKKVPQMANKRYSIPKRSAKTIERSKGRTEIDVFNEIWNERPRISELSGMPLQYDKSNMKMWVCQFLHVIPKGMSKKLRLEKRNIMLGTIYEHNHQDQYPAFNQRKQELNLAFYPVKLREKKNTF